MVTIIVKKPELNAITVEKGKLVSHPIKHNSSNYKLVDKVTKFVERETRKK